MQQDLQLTLTIIGVLIIGGVLLHGLWSTRRKTKKPKKGSFESHNWEHDISHDDDLDSNAPVYDDIGVGRARVVINPSVPKQDINFSTTADDDSRTEFTASDFSSNEHGDKNSQVENKPLLDPESSANHALNATEAGFAGNDHNGEQDKLRMSETNESSMHDVTIDRPQTDESSDAHHPMYSNVVTQPKPPLHKNANPEVTADQDSFGNPPSFLLKNEEGRAVQSRPQAAKQESNAHSHKVNDSVKSSDAELGPAKPDANFSLNMQEGHEGKENITENLNHNVEKELSFAEQAKRFVRRNKKNVTGKVRKDPNMEDKPVDEQMRIDFEESTNATKAKQTEVTVKEQANEQSNSANSNKRAEPTDVLVLNVRASDDNPIQGAALLPMLLTLGFKFGEHDIFHRHVTTNGKGPVLFSLTNMFKPGVFDIDNLENFNTYGISLFMMLPIEGDAQQVFNMMHNAARKLSEEFGCRILDGNKVGLSKQSLQQYIERIRDFERKRINR